MEFKIAGLTLFSYLAGGIPTGYLVARRFKGIDIREHGSGNPGTANVYRVCGALPGAITLFVDAAKGFLPTLLALRLYPHDLWIPMLCGSATIIGHDWTIFLGFRGGKGVATSAGVFAAMMPKTVGAAVLLFAAGIAASGHISVGSMTAAAALPGLCLAFGQPPALTAMALASGILIWYKHIPNLRLLLRGKKY